MVAEVVWPQKLRILDFIKQYGDNFARYMLGQDTIDQVTQAIGPLQNNCFRNCLVIAYHCPELFDYCEGFAVIEGNYYPHAWLFPKTTRGEKNQYWCIDPTYPWVLENFNNNQPLDKITYIGVRLNPIKTIQKLEELKGNFSILKFFNECNVKELLV